MKTNRKKIIDNNGKTHEAYQMTTSHGLTVSILSLGASIQKIAAITEDGTECPLALGFPDITAYEACACYAGATLGPNAGRIRDAKLPVNEQILELNRNDGHNQLHGGFHNLSTWSWQMESASCTPEAASILLSARQPDGLDGYPGNRHYQVRYTLEDTNWLTIQYTARSDVPTYVNLSNHTYWNLSGDFTKPALHQELTIFANSVCINDSAHLPVDIVPVDGTAFDFRKSQSLDSRMEAAFDSLSLTQLAIGQGYNHTYLLNKNHAFRTLRTIKQHHTLKKACILKDISNGRTVKLMTDAPALVLYSGGYLPDGLTSCAIALEAQDIPDVMHLLPEAYQLTTPEQPFHRTIRYHII